MMKRKLKDLYWIGVLLFLSSQLVAQTNQCENINGDFESFATPTVIANDNSWINNSLDNWYVTHGTPTVVVSPSTHMWMWSTYGQGEGVYTEFSFISGEVYELSYSLWMASGSDPNSEVRVELSNSLLPYFDSDDTLPITNNNQLLNTQAWSGTGTWIKIAETFKASQNYNQLWFYPYLLDPPTIGQAECRIDSVCIRKVTNPCIVFDYVEVGIDIIGSNPFSFDATGLPNGVLNSLGFHWDLGDGNTAIGQTVNHTYSLNVVGVDSIVYPVCLSVYYFNPDSAECCSRTICTDVTIYIDDPTDPIDDGGGGLAGGLVRHNGGQAKPYFESGLNYETEPIEDLDGRSKLLINPNPSKGMFQVQTLSEELINEVLVYSLEGKVVHQLTNVSQNDELTMDLKHLEPGTYIIISNQNNGNKIQAEKVFILP